MRPRPYLLALFVSQVAAQQNTFFWGFAGSSPNLQECGPLVIQILPMNAQTPIPSGPFTMLSYQPGGPTVNTPLVGTDPNNLQWVVPHSAGAQVLLQVVDSLGNSGGIPNNVFTVNAGPSTVCHSTNPSSFQMATAVTSAKTCDPIEVDFTGGKAPYTITVVAQGSSVVTNDTTGPNDNEYTYINRAPPNLPLLIAAHDATGQYAFNTPLIPLSGPTDVSCSGKASGGGIKGGSTTPSAGSPASSGAPASKTKANPTANPTGTAAKNPGTTQAASHSNTAAIAGGVAGGAVLIIGIVALLVFFCFRKRRNGSDGYRPGSQQYLTQSYANNGKVADESFGTRPMLPPSPQPSPGMQDYSVNQYVFNQNPSDPNRSSVALQYAPNAMGGAHNNSYSDHQSSSGRTDSTVLRTPQSLMYAHNLPGSPGFNPYPPEKTGNHPYAQQQYPPSPPQQQQSLRYPPQQQQQQQYAQQSYAQPNYAQPPQAQQSTMYAPYPTDSKQQPPPPQSVAYANSRLSTATSSADTRPNSNASRTHLLPVNVYGAEEEEESELAYSRLSTTSANQNSYPPQQQPQQSSSTSKGQPPAPEPQIMQHRDAGPVLEVPPAYGDRAS